MAVTIYVENLPSDITEDGLKDVFAQIGDVQSVRIKTDLLAMLTSSPKDYGVVDMTLDVDAYRAINCFEGATFKNRKIHVKEAYPLLEKAKTMFDHLTDGYSLSGFRPLALAALNRLREHNKNN
jgi:RNA recognition motif-containing protein